MVRMDKTVPMLIIVIIVLILLLVSIYQSFTKGIVETVGPCDGWGYCKVILTNGKIGIARFPLKGYESIINGPNR